MKKFVFIILSITMVQASAKQYIRQYSSGHCGPHTGTNVYVKNKHKTKAIKVKMRIQFWYRNEQRSNYKNYTVIANGKKFIGCTNPGPAMQTFNYSIQSANFK